MNKQPLIIPIKESGEIYILAHPYEISLINYGHDVFLSIPDGYVYDGASVPRWLWSISGLGIDGLHRAAALVHDYLYEKRGRIARGDSEYVMTRKQVDKTFRDMMKADSISDHKIWMAYVGVRLFGKSYWDND